MGRLKCTVSFVSVVLVILIVGILALLIIFIIPGYCPSTSFRCTENNQCLSNRFRCDGKQHCPNGSDELAIRCADLTNLDPLLDLTINNKSRLFSGFKRPRPVEEACYIQFPPSCICQSGFKVFCKNFQWDGIDWNKFDNDTILLTLRNVLTGDWIEDGNQSYPNFGKLQFLLIGNNSKMTTVPKRFLQNNPNLTSLFIEHNRISQLENGNFEALSKLNILYLPGNSIRFLDFNAFMGLDSLTKLDLSQNSIDLDLMFQFQGMPNLRVLELQSNQIQRITRHLVRKLVKLIQLNLSRNRIHFVHSRAFRYNKGLIELNLSHNFIHHLESDVFYGLSGLTKLSLASNPIPLLSRHHFASLRQLESLNLEELDLESIDLQIFSLFEKLKFVHFKKFEYCQYVPRVPKCRPSTDGISSLQNLLNGTTIRVSVWLITGITLFGNILVICSRWKVNKDTQILDVFIKNLAAADFLMGIYLGILGIKDLQYLGFFHSYAYKWTTSWECRFLGIIAMISSEVSLLILTVMSLERYLVITGPFSYKKMTRNWALASMILLWIFVGTLAVIPAIMWKSEYFGSSGLCFTFHLHDHLAVGWEYNAFVFIGLNSFCLACISIFYGRLFWVIRATSSLTPVVAKDLEMAIRFFFMVLTDFLCWAPIIGMKLAAFRGYRVPDSVLAWMTVLVMPLNSSINPLLYTFSTGKVRIRCFEKLFSSRSTVDSRNPRNPLESIEARLMTHDESKLNSSHDWPPPSGQKDSTASESSADQLESIALRFVGQKPRSRKSLPERQSSASSTVSDGTTGAIF